MIDFNNNIDEFLLSHPDSSNDDLKNAMGTPQEIADEFMANASPKEIKKRISTVRVLILCAVIIILIVTIFFVTVFIDAHNVIHGHSNQTIVDNGTIYRQPLKTPSEKKQLCTAFAASIPLVWRQPAFEGFPCNCRTYLFFLVEIGFLEVAYNETIIDNGAVKSLFSIFFCTRQNYARKSVNRHYSQNNGCTA